MRDLRPSWWHRRRWARELSEYADGELPAARAERLAEQLALDPDTRAELARLRAVDRLVNAALMPPPAPPAGSTAADRVRALPSPAARGRRSASPDRTRWTPLAVASVGLLVTAGLAVAGYRRRSRL